jgi:hypothetical protein
VFEALGVLVDEVSDERLGMASGGADESNALVLGAMLAHVGAAAVRRFDDSDLAVEAGVLQLICCDIATVRAERG